MRLTAICLIAMLNYSIASSTPGPGDLFREYVWKGPWVNAGSWQRVTDPDARHSGAGEFLPNPVNSVTIDDLDGAVRAELHIELWGGHAGTSDKRMRLNGGDWIAISEPEGIPGDAGLHVHPECYQYFTYPSVPLPLEQLREGDNTFEFTSGGQICFDFGWGQWGIYGITFRIYYDDAKPHATGRIVSPAPGSTFGDSLYIVVESPDSTVQRVDFIGDYEEFDYEGNGLYRQWHYNYRYGVIKRHLGTAFAPPYAVTWETDWVPDQEEPVRLMARIQDRNGVFYMTPAVGDLALVRPGRSVRLYKPYDVPGSWQTRANKRHRCKVFVPHDLHRATAAKMILATWSGGHADAIGINDTTIVRRVGKDHDYSYDEVDVPINQIRTGTNEFFTYSNTEHHGIEVLWPGIALKVQYEGQSESLPSLEGGGFIFADGLADGWRVEEAADDSEEIDLDLQATEQSYRGSAAIALEVFRSSWELKLIPPFPLDITGYRTLRFAFYPHSAAVGSWKWFHLYVNDRWVSLLEEEGETAGVDLEVREWQVVEILLDELDLRFPFLESLRFSGRFEGRFFLDEIHLVPELGSTAVLSESAAAPRAVRLQQNFPNPFNSGTTIRFSLPTDAAVDLGIYNLVGQRLVTLVGEERGPGVHSLSWDGRDAQEIALASGVYLYRLRVGGRVETRRLLLLR